MIPATLPRLNEISISWTVLLFALGVSVLAGAFFGLAPALQAARIDPIHVLRQEGRGSKGSRGQTLTLSALVVTEFALSLVLLIAAGLLLRSFWDLYNVRLGFDPENVMAVSLWLPCAQRSNHGYLWNPRSGSATHSRNSAPRPIACRE